MDSNPLNEGDERQPLAGTSVIELTTMVAGSHTGQMLGDLGADVVKIERPETGELARNLDPKINEESFYYLTVNRNKRSLALDVSSDEGREIFLDLVEVADVVIENYQPRFTDRFGIGYEDAREVNESIIYCSISAFGETGPYRDYPGIDTTVQALSGAMSMTRTEDTKPMRSGVPMNDVMSSLYAVSGIMIALLDRERGGSGQHIDISLLDTGISALTTRATYSVVSGEPYPPFGRRHNYFAPEGTYEVADGEIQLSVVTDRHWQRLCKAIDAPELLADERFETTAGRVEHYDELDVLLEAELSVWNVDDLVEQLRDAGVAAGPVNDTLSVWDDPQVKARDMLRTIDHPTEGEIDTLGFPVKYSEYEPSVSRHPPALGEHTREILGELGLENDQIDELVDRQVVGNTSA